MDFAAISRTPFQPAHRVAIGVVIDKQRCGSSKRKVAREVGCQCGLTATPLGVQNDDLVQAVSIRRNEHLRVGASPSEWRCITAIIARNGFSRVRLIILLNSPRSKSADCAATAAVLAYHGRR